MSPRKNHNVKSKTQVPVRVTSSTVKPPITTEEVVDTVNKYRKGLLNEAQASMVLTPTKEYTLPENVVKIIEEYRDKILVEHEIAPSKEGLLIDLSAQMTSLGKN
ncbi:hypothetical protein RhiirA5_430418 [Rhizophagus irregularis]|uniref:Uncharacterized protein n=1 Tax=Rhizophagus irregularis TaxID=588596 RepID=A0A2N0NWQ8_9GLOM|nr:hypothetical protein RhiirA5_430418 [Rhizophagus irregularis]CAB5309634.1 unnamed protein product [Rhizophagus irregularis]